MTTYEKKILPQTLTEQLDAYRAPRQYLHDSQSMDTEDEFRYFIRPTCIYKPSCEADVQLRKLAEKYFGEWLDRSQKWEDAQYDLMEIGAREHTSEEFDSALKARAKTANHLTALEGEIISAEKHLSAVSGIGERVRYDLCYNPITAGGACYTDREKGYLSLLWSCMIHIAG